MNETTAPRHDAVTQALHWLIALVILLSYGSSLVMEDLPRGAFQALVTGTHVSLGLLVLGLTALRLAWRVFATRPTPVETSPLLRRIARIAHGSLYAAMLAAPLLGFLMMWSKGREVGFFWLFTLPSPWPADRAFGRLLGEGHELAANALVLMAGLHAAAAIFHQLVLKDRLMERMLPSLGRFRT